jgi:hypothetical protein
MAVVGLTCHCSHRPTPLCEMATWLPCGRAVVQAARAAGLRLRKLAAAGAVATHWVRRLNFFQYFQKMLNILENVGENLFSKYWIQHFVYWCNSF